MNLIEVLKVLVLGIVEGFTEWLPISSTGHMILVDEIIHLDQTKDYVNMFTVVIQLGAILAVAVMYFHKLNPFSPRKTENQRMATLVLWSKIIVACLPAAVVGLLLNDWMEEHLMNPYVVAGALIIYGICFIRLEQHNQHAEMPVQKVSQITYRTAIYIGLFQLLSLVPGTSRSGSTILGAMILGCARGAAAEFSFFLGIPVMFGASFLKIVKYFLHGNTFTAPQTAYLLLGMLVAFVVSVYSIKFLLSYIKNNDFRFFGYYRIILGIIVVVYFAIMAFAG